MRAKVSLYIPCYNAHTHIEGCLKGVFAQTCRIDEILVIDDGPGSETARIASRYPVKLIRRRPNPGLPSARNEAFRLARNGLVASLDADCIPQPDWLERLADNLADGNIAGACGRLVEKYTDTPPDKWRSLRMRQDWGADRIVNPPYLFGNNNIFRKDAVVKTGLYDEKYAISGEDSDISRRLLLNKYNLVYEPRSVAEHIRKDNVFSILKTHWSWNLYLGERMPVNLNHLARRVYGNLRWSAKYLAADFLRGDASLLPIDLFLFFSHSFHDLHYYLIPGDRDGKKN